MSKFENLQLTDAKLAGTYSSPVTGNIVVVFDLEADNAEYDDFSELMAASNEWLNNLSAAKLDELKMQMAVELTDAAYEESDYTPDTPDYKGLQQDLTIMQIRFYPDDIISLVIYAEKEYPEMLIYCQISTDLEIEDLVVS